MGLYPISLKDLIGIPWDGEVFGVDPTSGADTNLGTKRNQCFATMQTAVDACVANRGDMIVRFPGTENPTTAILFNKAGVVVRSSDSFCGGSNPYEPEKFSTYPAAAYATGPTAIISQPTTLWGLEFVTRNVTHVATDACTTVGAAVAFAGEGGGYAGGFSHLYRCRFVDWWGNAYGLWFAAGAYNTIEECSLEGFDSAVAFYSTASNNPAFNTIKHCTFKDNTQGIEHVVGATPGNHLYMRNVFIDYTDAIDFNQATGGAGNGLICDNFFETATDAATFDCTVGQAQAIGWQFSGNHYSE